MTSLTNTVSGNVTDTTRYYYDGAGNTIAEQRKEYTTGSVNSDMSLSGCTGSGGTLKLYQYDAFNRLIQYNDGETEATYTYNANNLRASKTVNGEKTDFVWSGQNLAGETKNSVTTAYTYDMTGIALSNADNESSSNYVRYIKDPHGNVIAALKNGKTVGEYDYTAFGTQLKNSSTISNPFRYCGEYYDEELDSVYLRNRYYSPSTGRFITEDPAKDGLNWYVYCGNEPVMAVDPWGLDIYYLVNSQLKKEAYDDLDSLEEQYGEPVHILEVNSKTEFVTAWNGMGNWDGENVSVSLVIINMHGDPKSISTNKDGSDPIDINDLIPKNLGGIVLLNCNTGHLDHKYNTFAKQMLIRNNVGYVIAADGTVAGDRMALWHVPCKYSTHATSRFYSYNWVHPQMGQLYRNQEGFIRYTKNSIGELVWEILGTTLDLTNF